MEGKKRIAINMVAQFISFVINIAINFYLTPYITANVGKEVYGFVNLAFQTTGYITIFTTALNAMLGRYITISLSKKDYESANIYFSSVILANIIMSVVMAGPTAIGLMFLDKWLHIPAQYVSDVKLLWFFIFVDFFLGLCTNCYGIATYARNRLDLGARRSLENNVIRVVMLLGLFYFFEPKVWYVGASKFVVGFWIIITNVYYTRTLTPELRYDRAKVRLSAIKELVKVGVWSSVQQLSTILINGCDMLITNKCIDAASMTLMGFSKTIPNYLMSIIGIVAGSFGPQMMIIYAEGDMNKFVKYVKSAIKVCGFICSIPIIGFTVFGSSFFSLWIPVLSTGEVRTVQILSIMILAQTVFDVYIYPLYSVTQVTARLRLPVLVSIGIGVANVIGSVVLCLNTNLGVYAIQIVSSVLLIARVFFFAPLYAAYILNQKWYTFYTPLFRGMAATAVSLVIFIAVAMHVTIDSWVDLFICGAVCGAIGYAVNYIIVLDKEEREMVGRMIRRKLPMFRS
ncbi:Membrane protein involved in the export of O-antigen and teichoic acid [Lachnospiraceae bacterium]|nr:Membrane protein involved in the export of O-antigen and teichoic acid [Lachnospiraceae bacterium]